jgi:prepilin-type N-terminal cleavage/methylation domain-containing protein
VSAAGFTLLEAMVTLVIFALAAAVVVPSMSKSSLAELRSNAGKVAGTVRATYDRAALGGRIHRLAFDFKTQSIRVEFDNSGGANTGGLMKMVAALARHGDGTKPTPQDALKGLKPADGEKGGAEPVPPPRQVLALLGATEADDSSTGLGRFADAGHTLTLPEDVHLMDVWVEGMSQPLADGTAYLQFFPGGYTENALIHLTTTEGTVFTVKVEALTGGTSIVGSYVEGR